MSELKTHFDLEMEPTYNKLGWKTFGLAQTNVAAVRGDALSTYELLPVVYIKKLMDAAKASTRFLETVKQEVVPKGANQVIIPRRKNYMAEGDWTAGGEEPTSITSTAVSTADGVALAPTDYNYRVDIPYKALRTNQLNIIEYAQDEMTNYYNQKTDTLIRDQTMGTAHATDASATGPTAMADATVGAQIIFGGSATDADDNLDAGDVLTPTMINKADMLLRSDIGYFWDSNVWTAATSAKNPWENTPQEPFVLTIAPQQLKALRDESDFVNAAEYGSDKVVMTGEIGDYLGTKVVVTSKTDAFVDNDYVYIGGENSNPLVDVAGHVCMMAKAFKYAALAWGSKPTLKVFDYPSTAEVRILLNMAVATEEVFPDAMVRMVVADE